MLSPMNGLFVDLLQAQENLEEKEIEARRYKNLVGEFGEEKAKEIEAVGTMLQQFSEATTKARCELALEVFASKGKQ